MCGIAGFISKTKFLEQDALNILKDISSTLIHRGPDDYDALYLTNHSVGLCHRRLSIQDLSKHGRQPMLSRCKRYLIVFNGEIYNHIELRKEMSQVSFRGTSDTETLINYISIFGIDRTLERIKGQFAFAVLDQIDGKLSLVRDRAGEKPLYYYSNSKVLIFSSELKAIKRFPNINLELCWKAIDLFLQFSYVPSPLSIFKGVKKLPPGNILTINLTDFAKSSLQEYFTIRKIRENQSFNFNDQDLLINELDRKINESVKSQLISDVPIGGLLSGGIDSSLICKYMQENMSSKLNTYTIGFNNKSFDESKVANRVAKEIGSDHHEFILNPKLFIDLIPKILHQFDEPFADSSQIPTYIVMHEASKHVKVVLSGDGADEIFGGYNRYLYVESLYKIQERVPKVLFNSGLKFLNLLPKNFLNRLNFKNLSQLGSKFEKISSKKEYLHNPDELYVSMLREDPRIIFNSSESEKHPIIDHKDSWPKANEFTQQMMLLDIMTYLPDDILTKVDRTSMMCSIESRAPFLDKDLMEFAISIPANIKIQSGTSKFLLKKILEKKLPNYPLDNPKKGFSIPLDNWIRNDLRDWTHETITNSLLFEKDQSLAILNNFLNYNITSTLMWNVLVLETWIQNNT